MTTQWTDVAALADLFDGAGIAVTPADHDIALYSVDGAVYATDNLCPHGNARLCDGFIEGLEIECPFHQGRFDLRTGQPTCAPATESLKTWPVKIDGDRVYLALD